MSVQFQQLERYRRIIEIDFPLRQLLQQISRQRVRIYFQSRGERRLWTEAGSNPTEPGPLDGQVQVQHVAAEHLVAERIKSKNLSPLGYKLGGICGCGVKFP